MTKQSPDLQLYGADNYISDRLSQDYGDRGTLTLSDKVATKLTKQAVLEVTGVHDTSPSLLNVFGSGYPAIDLEVTDNFVRVAVGIAVIWPTPLSDAASRVRDRVIENLRDLGGFSVDNVDVAVRQVTNEQKTAVRRRVV